MFVKLRFLILIVFIFYAWICTQGREPYWQYSPDGWYNLLTDSFLEKQLHFLAEPRPELLALKDPYNPIENGPYRMHDMSLYKGKYYMYYGITPLIVFYLPFRLLTGIKLPDNLAVLLFSFGGFMWAVLLLNHIRRLYFPAAPKWMMFISVAVLGFANVVPFNLKRPMMYEVAISSGFFFLMGAMFFLCREVAKINPNKFLLGLGSLFLGLSIGGRPTLLLSTLIIPLIYLKVIEGKHNFSCKFKYLLALGLPLLSCLFLLGMYNYLRFDNPFEFGINYSTTVYNPREMNIYDLDYIPRSLYLYFLQPPLINSTFPFFHLFASVPALVRSNSPSHVEVVLGIIPGVPFVPLLLLLPITFWLGKLVKCRETCFKNKILKRVFLWVLIILFSLYLLPVILQIFKKVKLIDQLINLSQKITSLGLYSLFVIFIFVLLYHLVIWLKDRALTCNTLCYNSAFSSFPFYEFSLVILSALLTLVGLSIVPFVTMRYVADFITNLIIGSSIMWFYIDSQLAFNPKLRGMVSGLAIIFGIGSIIPGIAFGIEPYCNHLRVDNPMIFYKIESYFSSILNFLH